MARRSEGVDVESRSTALPRSEEAEIGDLVDGSEASTKARRRQGDRGPVRMSSRSPAKTVGKPVRMTLTLSAEAAKRLRDRAHNTGVKPGVIASELFVAHVPRYSTRLLDRPEDELDIGEDRQSEAA